MNNRNTHIEAENLRVRFDDRILFQDVSFQVLPGEFVVVTGENGCGKTTLVKMILGLLPVQEGNLHVMDCRVGTSDWKKIRKKVSYVNQHAVTPDFPVSAHEVVEIGTAVLDCNRNEKKRLVHEAMAAMNCLHLEKSPYGVLSGGEKQRISLARCLCQKPGMLVLDEPSSYLDRQSKKDLLESLDRLNRGQGITVIMVSHEFHDAHQGKLKMLHMENDSMEITETGEAG